MKTSKLLLLGLLTFCGCIGINKPIPTTAELVSSYDVNALKSTDNTYRIQENQPIQVYADGKKTELKFDTDWFVVHKDWLKTFNENQDYILKSIRSSYETPKMNVPLVIGLVIFILLLMLILIRLIKNGKSN